MKKHILPILFLALFFQGCRNEEKCGDDTLYRFPNYVRLTFLDEEGNDASAGLELEPDNPYLHPVTSWHIADSKDYGLDLRINMDGYPDIRPQASISVGNDPDDNNIFTFASDNMYPDCPAGQVFEHIWTFSCPEIFGNSMEYTISALSEFGDLSVMDGKLRKVTFNGGLLKEDDKGFPNSTVFRVTVTR